MFTSDCVRQKHLWRKLQNCLCSSEIGLDINPTSLQMTSVGVCPIAEHRKGCHIGGVQFLHDEDADYQGWER